MTPNLLDELEKAAGSRYSEDDVRACAKRMKFYDHQIAASILTEYADRMSSLADMAKRMEAAERELDIRRHELAHERAVRDRLERHLISIHALLYPAPIEVDGRVCVFRPRLIDPHEVMQELSDRIRAIPTAIDATQEGAG